MLSLTHCRSVWEVRSPRARDTDQRGPPFLPTFLVVTGDMDVNSKVAAEIRRRLSRRGLNKHQLEFEGFTHDQAEYGAKKALK